MNDEQQAFLDAIKADRYDGATRKVFADWLSEHALDDEAEVQRRWTPEKQKAEDWMREIAAEHNYSEGYADDDGNVRAVTYEELIKAGHDFLNYGERFTQMGDDSLSDYTSETLKEYWEAWSLITGVPILDQDKTARPFACSC